MSELTLSRRPWHLGALELPHRIVMGSMHTGAETLEDGGASLAAFYRERVAGGASLIVTGGLAVDAAGRGGPDYAVLTEPAVVERLSHVTAEVHAAGGRILAQLFHAGRYAITGGAWQAVAPSVVPWRAARGELPRELRADEIAATIAAFADAAVAARTAGFDGVEIMASEGYLLNEFLSPLTNLRDDEFGGDAARRLVVPSRVVSAVRGAVGEGFPVTVRISGDDLMPGSSPPEEHDGIAVAIAGLGVDALSVGVGWHESAVPTVQLAVPKGAWVAIAERIAVALDAADAAVPVIASNRITSLGEAEAVLARGRITAVALARPFLADPAIVARSFAGSPALVNPCIGCDQACIDRSLVFRRVSCLVNPRAGRETELPLAIETRRRIAVVGAGPAGLAAAEDLVRRGHAVTLFEERERLGGQFALAALVPGKADYGEAVRAAERRLRAAGAELRLGCSPRPEELADFDGVVLATGVRPRPIDLEGALAPHVLDYETAFVHGVPEGSVAIIGGGGIAVDLAASLVEPSDPGRRAEAFAAVHGVPGAAALAPPRMPEARAPRLGAAVTMLRRSGRFGAGIGITSRWVALAALERAGVRMRSGIAYRRIIPGGVEIEGSDGAVELVPGETVVVCAGQEPNDPLGAALTAMGIRHELAGGVRGAAGLDAVRATSEGLAAARAITR